MQEFFIGLMSGTSLDGVDGVLAGFSGPEMRVIAAASVPFPERLQHELLALNAPGPNELHRAALAGNQIATIYASVVARLMESATQQGVAAAAVKAIGAHGQTVRHQPPLSGTDHPSQAYTVQLNNPALLAELTGIDVVADFRSRDVAAGGQGAPLVPAFHHSVFSKSDSTVVVLNLGGIANISVLPGTATVPAMAVLGFDCGPGNALMDAWCQRHTKQAFDAGGAWAASGQLIPDLLVRLLEEPYFSRLPPKSTGRDLFNLGWLETKLAPWASQRPQDIQHTLTELTASTCIAAINSYKNNSTELIVCGGGAFNQHLMQRLKMGLPTLKVSVSDAHGVPAQQVEAAAFAWLARQTISRQPGNLASVTGAAGPRILGAIYPA